MSGSRQSAELVLGTAQLGQAYGIANTSGQPSADDAALILRTAVSAGVRWIDTAAAYGCSERRVGAAFPGCRRIRVATKLAPLAELSHESSPADVRQAVAASVRRSLSRLGADRLDVLMLHRAQHLTACKGAVWQTLRQFRNEGLIYDLGVSVYSPNEASAALDDADVRHIQVPFNLLDWRWRESGVIEALTERPDVTIHARSALLQGLLVAGPEIAWPAIDGMDPLDLKARLARLARDLERDGIADLCLAYVRGQTWIDGVVVGVETFTQLALNLALFRRPALTAAEIELVERTLPQTSERLLNPALWPKAA